MTHNIGGCDVPYIPYTPPEEVKADMANPDNLLAIAEQIRNLYPTVDRNGVLNPLKNEEEYMTSLKHKLDNVEEEVMVNAACIMAPIQKLFKKEP